ncbi:growth-regulating factor 4-like [Vigna umbellata]|uniref:growth-regulating factor 4-like n=1 Tax=Vigna umbellata TaxID=87088 RepID=UPI001F5ED79D|nr:growth-regulating factor 4-like [Vigna umbellata]
MSVPPPSTAAMWTPFTAAQWHELEHQALIFKYLKAGLSVPPDLLLPIRKSLQFMAHPSLGGYYGKKIDPEPGRCRRTDGKKWRCSRDAHPDSKYCDRHMIRRRYRSRKPVESQPHSSSASSNPVAASASAASSATGSATSSATGSAAASATTLNTLPLHTNGAREGFTFTLGNSATTATPTLPHLHMDPLTLSGDNTKKTYRFGLNSEADEHVLQKDLGSVRYQGYDFTSDSMWSHMSPIPSSTVSESRSGSTMLGNCFQQQTMRDAELLNLETARTKDLIFSSQLSSAGSLKQEYQSPQSLFSDWDWKKDLTSSAIEYRPNKDFNCNPDANVD